MIFYFSGTGNSLYAAKKIAEHNGERLINIAEVVSGECASYEYRLQEQERIGFVYPTYAWNAPQMVYEFIKKVKFLNYSNNYIFAVTTMGENTGDIKKCFEKVLEPKNLRLNSAFSIAMPNNYVVFGDVYDDKTEEKLLLEADNRIEHINAVVEKREDQVFEVKKVALSGVLTSIVNPLFMKSAKNTKPFYATDACIGCGLCERVCNCHTIKVSGKPSWGKDCTQCLACLHLCPTQAIQYGKRTEKKGRYKNPSIRIDELANK